MYLRFLGVSFYKNGVVPTIALLTYYIINITPVNKHGFNSFEIIE